MKPLRRSAIFITGLVVLVLLLGLAVDSFFWSTSYQSGGNPVSYRVTLRSGSLSVSRGEYSGLPEWATRMYASSWSRQSVPRRTQLLQGRYWMPEPYTTRSNSARVVVPGSDGKPVALIGTWTEQRVQLPIWQLITLHVILCWVALALRQRRQRRKWEHQQAAGDPQLLEPS